VHTSDGCLAYKFIEKFFTYRFVMSLRVDFEAIRTRLLHGSAILTMSEALSDLLAEETRLQSMCLLTIQYPIVCWHPLKGTEDLRLSPMSTARRPHIGQKIAHMSLTAFIYI
jgi:hypothetical protein